MNDKERHDQLDELLPWYVTGSLNEADTDDVEAALASHANATALVNEETALSRRIARANAGVDDVLARQSDAFEQLRQRLHQPAEREQGTPLRTSGWRQVCAATLSVLVVTLVATSPWLAPSQPAGSFTTLTESTASGVVQLAVAAGVTPAQVQRLLAQLHGSVVSGPTRHNVYLIALPAGSDVAWLRQQPGVSFVGPAE
jgi:anti-sigma-K factor RskA